jgi:hypothetical protein
MAGLLAYVAHLIACVWWMVGNSEAELKQGWVYKWEFQHADPNATAFRDDGVATHWCVPSGLVQSLLCDDLSITSGISIGELM